MEPLINSSKSVIASVARQSHTMESVRWRLPRYARNGDTSEVPYCLIPLSPYFRQIFQFYQNIDGINAAISYLYILTGFAEFHCQVIIFEGYSELRERCDDFKDALNV